MSLPRARSIAQIFIDGEHRDGFKDFGVLNKEKSWIKSVAG